MIIVQLIKDLNRHYKSSAYNKLILCSDQKDLFFVREVKVTNGMCYIFYEDNPSEYSMTTRGLVAELRKYKWQSNYPVEFIHQYGNHPYSNFTSNINNYNVVISFIY